MSLANPAGTNQQEEVEAGKRVGVLWDYYRQLVKDGWEPDVYSYTTSFRQVSLMVASLRQTSRHHTCLSLWLLPVACSRTASSQPSPRAGNSFLGVNLYAQPCKVHGLR